MDTRQVLRQLKFIAERMTWPSGAVVFSRVVVSPGIGLESALRPALPALVIEPVESVSAGEHSLHRRLTCRLIAFAENAADPSGEAVVVDAARTADSSKGAGLARLCAMLGERFATLAKSDGIAGLARLKTAMKLSVNTAGKGGSSGVFARAVAEIVVDHVEAPTFPPVVNFSATAGGAAGEIALAWQLPSVRFDHAGVHVRRKTGSAPASPADGVAVYTGADGAFIDAGLDADTTYFYAAWATFDAAANVLPMVADTFSDAPATAFATAPSV